MSILSVPSTQFLTFLLWLGFFGAFANARREDPPHPWIADAPGEIVRLIRIGHVRIVIDDDRVTASKRSALTSFRVQALYKAKFRYEWIELGHRTQTWKARILANLQDPRVQIEHQVIVSSAFQPPDPWKSELMLHEFDHVSISTDPRLLKIINRILSRKRTQTEEWMQPEKPSDEDIRLRLESIVDNEVRSFEALIQHQYDWLDQQTTNGTQTMGDRLNFFQELYSYQGLERCEYEKRELVREYLQKARASETEKEINRHYLLLK